eukprot:Protomagalhaensia_wolfi_Nauph_80__3770@NODE_3813_length_703_cov_528_367470_g3010_i0_p1_GENE_NODE_3813_length_703_cov_528_367470_g3010_i0NODE_3813_length_703_cov_528_367470_g3010_i0_p1_ORF_typecomplete_len135_score18_68RNA_pol_L_2/PF13656_6/6_2e03RNA_pol_L_2/PF13656_6/7_2e25RNA_pol_L/PF01193_24/5_5RNA_pol_L/PF01193_24/0_55_NODE_3813_length_703_cov_528_367470_g3010_i0173577
MNVFVVDLQGDNNGEAVNRSGRKKPSVRKMMSYVNVDETGSKEKAFSSQSITLTIEKEDHTLGNSLRSILSSRPDIEFAGYSIPHPTETRFNLRIQSATKTPAMEIFGECVDDLIGLGNVVLEKFDEALKEHMK